MIPRLSKRSRLMYANRKELPPVCGVYLVVSSVGDLLYVGCSQNIKTRFLSHHIRGFFRDGLIYWKGSKDLNAAQKLEQRLITRFKPQLNKVGGTTPRTRALTLDDIQIKQVRDLILSCEYQRALAFAAWFYVQALSAGAEQEAAELALMVASDRMQYAEPIRKALMDSPSVIHAADRLGLTQQGLNFLINTKYPELKQIKVDGRVSRP